MAIHDLITDPTSRQIDAANNGLTPALSSYQINNFLLRLSASGTSAHVTVIDEGGSIAANAAAHLLVRSLDYVDLLYDRVHVIPGAIDLGNIASDQFKDVEVWNAHFVPVVLTLVNKVDLDAGVIWEAVAPRTFAALESVIYGLEVRTVGDPTIAGHYDLTFDTGEVPRLGVVGVRIVAFAFAHDWSADFTESLEWLTKIYTSDDGHEQGVKHRARARRAFAMNAVLAVSQEPRMNARVRARLRAMLHGWQHQTFAVPVASDATRLQSAVAAGTDTIPVATAGRDYEVGSYVLLMRDPFTFELAEIKTVAAGQLVTTRGLVQSWSPYITKLAPARLARMKSEIEIEEITQSLDSVAVEWDVLVSEESVNRVGVWSAPLYRTLPVWTRKPQLIESETTTAQVSRSIVVTDYRIGNRTYEARTPAPRTLKPVGVVLVGRAEISAFFGWLNARAGAFGLAWFPTWAFDLELVEVLASNGTVMTVFNAGYRNFYTGATNRRDVMIRRKDGMVYYRRITGAVDNDDGTESLTIDSALGLALAPAEVDRISFLRLASLNDRASLTWLTDDKVITQMEPTDLVHVP